MKMMINVHLATTCLVLFFYSLGVACSDFFQKNYKLWLLSHARKPVKLACTPATLYPKLLTSAAWKNAKNLSMWLQFRQHFKRHGKFLIFELKLPKSKHSKPKKTKLSISMYSRAYNNLAFFENHVLGVGRVMITYYWLSTVCQYSIKSSLMAIPNWIQEALKNIYFAKKKGNPSSKAKAPSNLFITLDPKIVDNVLYKKFLVKELFDDKNLLHEAIKIEFTQVELSHHVQQMCTRILPEEVSRGIQLTENLSLIISSFLVKALLQQRRVDVNDHPMFSFNDFWYRFSKKIKDILEEYDDHYIKLATYTDIADYMLLITTINFYVLTFTKEPFWDSKLCLLPTLILRRSLRRNDKRIKIDRIFEEKLIRLFFEMQIEQWGAF